MASAPTNWPGRHGRTKRLIIPALVLVVAGLMAAPAFANAAPGKAKGDVTYEAGGLLRTGDLSVEEASPGQAASGFFNYTDANSDYYTVEIDCVLVVGDTAYFAGQVIDASRNIWMGEHLHAAVQDNGKHSAVADRVWGQFVGKTAGSDPCSDDLTAVPPPPFEVLEGDLKVKAKA